MDIRATDINGQEWYFGPYHAIRFTLTEVWANNDLIFRLTDRGWKKENGFMDQVFGQLDIA